VDPQITLVTLGVSDLAEAVRFYRDGLGLPMQDRDEDSDVAFFPLDGAWLSLYPRDLLAEDATVPAEGSGFSGAPSPTTSRRRPRSTPRSRRPPPRADAS
jgi:catechol 2,3-dioxygenase-like lactoylglutathione lyase family enzyme